MGFGNEWAMESNELPYVPDLHIAGTVKKQNSLTFWMHSPLYEIGYSKIKWGKKEKHEGNKLERT